MALARSLSSEEEERSCRESRAQSLRVWPSAYGHILHAVLWSRPFDLRVLVAMNVPVENR